jgi:hypothetical protein
MENVHVPFKDSVGTDAGLLLAAIERSGEQRNKGTRRSDRKMFILDRLIIDYGEANAVVIMDYGSWVVNALPALENCRRVAYLTS